MLDTVRSMSLFRRAPESGKSLSLFADDADDDCCCRNIMTTCASLHADLATLVDERKLAMLR